MGSKSIYFTHLNCHNSVAASNQLARDVHAAVVDVASLNEPCLQRICTRHSERVDASERICKPLSGDR